MACIARTTLGLMLPMQLSGTSSMQDLGLRSSSLVPRSGRPQQHSCILHASLWQEVQGKLPVLAFSALPFLSVQALADSGLGKRLRANIDDNKATFEREEKERANMRAEARADSMWFGAERPRWLGPVDYSYPQHLRGDAPGDYGYDIASLGQEPADFERYFNYEILHGRWAMLGGLGALVPEALQLAGLSDFKEYRWWNVGRAKLSGEDLNYFGLEGFRIAGGQGILIIVVCQVLLMFGPEYARSCGPAALEPLGIYLPGDANYPGGAFDPLGLSKDPASYEDLRVKEIKNARLSMVAWVGWAAQAALTRKGPLENLLDFARDPVHENVFAYLSR